MTLKQTKTVHAENCPETRKKANLNLFFKKEPFSKNRFKNFYSVPLFLAEQFSSLPNVSQKTHLLPDLLCKSGHWLWYNNFGHHSCITERLIRNCFSRMRNTVFPGERVGLIFWVKSERLGITVYYSIYTTLVPTVSKGSFFILTSHFFISIKGSQEIMRKRTKSISLIGPEICREIWSLLIQTPPGTTSWSRYTRQPKVSESGKIWKVTEWREVKEIKGKGVQQGFSSIQVSIKSANKKKTETFKLAVKLICVDGL